MPVIANPPAQVSTEESSVQHSQARSGNLNPLADSLREAYIGRDLSIPLKFNQNLKLQVGMSSSVEPVLAQPLNEHSLPRPTSFSGSYHARPDREGIGSPAGVGGPDIHTQNKDPYRAHINSHARPIGVAESVAQELGIERFDWVIYERDGRVVFQNQIAGPGYHLDGRLAKDSVRIEGGGELIENLVEGITGNSFKKMNVRLYNGGNGWKLGTSAAFETGPLTLSVGSGVEDYFNLPKEGRLLHNTLLSTPDGAPVLGANLHLASYSFDRSPGLLASELKLGNCNLLLANDPVSKTNVLAGKGFCHLEEFFRTPINLNAEGAYIQQRDHNDNLHHGIGGGIRLQGEPESGSLSLLLRGYGTKSELPSGAANHGGSDNQRRGEFSIGLEFLR